jgi:hypothetical protein
MYFGKKCENLAFLYSYASALFTVTIEEVEDGVSGIKPS